MNLAENPVDGTKIAWDEKGEGEPLLLVHGSGLTRAPWRGFGYVRAFAETRRVITLDMRGHGRSDKPSDPEQYAMPLLLDDVTAVLDAAGAESADYIGYSFGARVGFFLLAERALRIRSFVSMAGTWRSPAGAVAALFFPEYDEALVSGGMPAFIEGWEAARGTSLDPSTRQAFLSNDAPALRAYFSRMNREEGIPEELLTQLATPTLLIAGDRDVERRDASLRAAELMPNARYAELAGRDHAGTLSAADEIIPLVQGFLN